MSEEKDPKKTKNRFQNVDVGIQHEGKKIVLPKEPHSMNAKEAIEILERWDAAENKKIVAVEIIPGFPLDGVVAFYKAMQRVHGLALPVDTPGLFGPRPPQILSIKTGPGKDDILQVPFGSFIVPGIENPIQMGVGQDSNGRPCLQVHVELRKKEQHVLLNIASEARNIVREESIYRGKPFTLEVDEDGDLDFWNPPEFMDVSDVDENNIILNEDTLEQVNTSLLTPIKKTEMCRRLKIPLKRGILLAGPYGTGKTLAARTAAKVAKDNGWTFINLTRVEGLKTALQVADQYGPAVVFAEDIDRVTEERDDNANDLVNTVDGILSKTSEVIVVLTTNHLESIQPVMLRPGRLDAVIVISPPDAQACERLFRLYARDLLPKDEDLTEACLEVAGQIPATIREVVERSKLGMIGRGADKLSTRDLVIAAKGMVEHLTLLNKKRDEPSDAEKLATSLRDVLSGSGNSLEPKVDDLQHRLRNLAGLVKATGQQVIEKQAEHLGEVKGAVTETREHMVSKVDAHTQAIAAHVSEKSNDNKLKVEKAKEEILRKLA